MDLLSSPSRKSKARTVAVIVAASGILAATLAVVRATGIPIPPAVHVDLSNDLWYLAAEWLGVRGDGGRVCRAFTDESGRRDYRLVRGVFRDDSGHELSRVVDGNGVMVSCRPSGALAKLEMFSRGLRTAPYILWSESGALAKVGFVEHPSGNLVDWSFFGNGTLRYASKRAPDGTLLSLKYLDSEGKILVERGKDVKESVEPTEPIFQ